MPRFPSSKTRLFSLYSHRLNQWPGPLLIITIALSVIVWISNNSLSNLIRLNTIESELPLTGDRIYAELHQDFVRPVHIAAAMANNTFIIDWLLAGENDRHQVSKYLGAVAKTGGVQRTFLVSENSGNYYIENGVLKTISANSPQDQWFYRVAKMSTDHEINIDTDSVVEDTLTMFVNFRVVDYSGRFIGSTGIGVPVSELTNAVIRYTTKFQHQVTLVDMEGNIVAEHGTSYQKGSTIIDKAGLSDVFSQIQKMQGSDHQTYQYYGENGKRFYLNARHIPELKWFLLVQKQEIGITQDGLKLLFISLLIVSLALLTNIIIQAITIRQRSIYLHHKQQGLATMSHDLKHLIHSLRILLSPTSNHNDQLSDSTVSRMRILTDDIQALGERFLSLYRLDVGAKAPKMDAVRLSDILSQLSSEATPLLEVQNRKLIVGSAGDLWVYTDRLLLQVILRNFVVNSIKYAKSGDIRVVVDCNNTSRSVRIQVFDYGPGVDAETKSKMFELFGRGITGLDEQGEGIGLYLVSYYAKKLGCRIGIDDSYTEGACFWISIPIASPNQIATTLTNQHKFTSVIALAKFPLSEKRLAIASPSHELANLCEKWGAQAVRYDSATALNLTLTTFDLIVIDNRCFENDLSRNLTLERLCNPITMQVPVVFVVEGESGLSAKELFSPSPLLAIHPWPPRPARLKEDILRLLRA